MYQSKSLVCRKEQMKFFNMLKVGAGWPYELLETLPLPGQNGRASGALTFSRGPPLNSGKPPPPADIERCWVNAVVPGTIIKMHYDRGSRRIYLDSSPQITPTSPAGYKGLARVIRTGTVQQYEVDIRDQDGIVRFRSESLLRALKDGDYDLRALIPITPKVDGPRNPEILVNFGTNSSGGYLEITTPETDPCPEFTSRLEQWANEQTKRYA